jgi:putative RNA 2'-phosphotransferase
MGSHADLVQLSRKMSLALRHEPRRFGLDLDGEGFVALEALATALGASPDAIRRVVAEVEADKQRFSIVDDDIRANYGHSLADRVAQQAATPPPVLLHGTHSAAVATILREGLRPMARQYVHLTSDESIASRVGGRRGTAVLLRVDTLAAMADGVVFFRANDTFWLVDALPARFLALAD